jgi:AraC family transcriptional activator of pobA
VRLFRGSLAHSEWTFRGIRNSIFLIVSGSSLVRLGARNVSFAGPALLWLPSGETGSLVIGPGSEGAALAIPDPMLGSAMPSGAIFAQVREAIAKPILSNRLSKADAGHVLGAITTIEQELKEEKPGTQEVLRHHLALLLLAIWRLADPVNIQTQPSPRAIVRGFVHLIELEMRNHWAIPAYAAALGVTADRLNTAVRRATGRSPMDLVNGRLMTEAATLLDNSAMQTAEIADLLGFKDAAYFSRFFRRHAGTSPRDFRTSKMRKKDEPNFSSWP